MGYSIHDKFSENSLIAFCKQYNIKKLSIFGSAIKGKLRPDSDIDILVEFQADHTPGLIRLAGIQIELSKIIGREVDLRTPEDLSRYFRDEVVNSAEVQYAES